MNKNCKKLIHNWVSKKNKILRLFRGYFLQIILTPKKKLSEKKRIVWNINNSCDGGDVSYEYIIVYEYFSLQWYCSRWWCGELVGVVLYPNARWMTCISSLKNDRSNPVPYQPDTVCQH